MLLILAFCKLNQYRLSIKLLLDPHTFQLSVRLLLKSNQMMNLVLNTTMYQCKPVFKLAKEMCVLKYCQKQALKVRDSMADNNYTVKCFYYSRNTSQGHTTISRC